MVNGRTIAIGDVHGCLDAFQAVLAAIEPRSEDTIVMLGDYVDRGPNSRGVLQELLDLGTWCRLVPLLGNHDEMFLDVCTGRDEYRDSWLMYGGDATEASYGMVPEAVPREHVDLLVACRLWFETDTHLFVHANYHSDRPLEGQPPGILCWESIRDRVPKPHVNGKTAIVGHTSQKSGEVLDLGYLKCIDTYCYGDGRLTAMDVETGQLWQADKQGRMRG